MTTGLIGDVRRVEQARVQALRAESCRDELRDDLPRLRVDLTSALLASGLGDDVEHALVQARRQVRRIRQPQRLSDVLLDDAAVRKRLHRRTEAGGGLPLEYEFKRARWARLRDLRGGRPQAWSRKAA